MICPLSVIKMPYVPPHLRNKTADVDTASVSSGSSEPKAVGGGGYVPPHLRNKTADAENMPFGDDGPKFEVYTSEITEVVEQPKKAGYVPPGMRKNEPQIIKKKAAELTEDDFPDLGAGKPAVVTGKSVAWGKKLVVATAATVATVVNDISQNSFAVLSEEKECDVPVVKFDASNKWSKKLDVTAANEVSDEKDNIDDGKHIRLTYDGAVRWWLRFASRPVYVPLDARNYYDDYSNCTHIPHSGLREYNGGYDDYVVHMDSDPYVYNEEIVYEYESEVAEDK
jgi:hypothetical protein